MKSVKVGGLGQHYNTCNDLSVESNDFFIESGNLCIEGAVPPSAYLSSGDHSIFSWMNR